MSLIIQALQLGIGLSGAIIYALEGVDFAHSLESVGQVLTFEQLQTRRAS